jgi:hypothetical protein
MAAKPNAARGPTPAAQSNTVQPYAAYDPPHADVALPWRLLVGGLLLTAIAGLLSRPVCWPDAAGANERGLGVHHERRAGTWYHCEPWVRALTGNRR